MISDNKLSERELRKWKEAEELSDKYEYEKLKSHLSELEEEKESFFHNRMGGSKRVKQIDIEIKELKKQMSKFTQDAMDQLALMGITQDAEPSYKSNTGKTYTKTELESILRTRQKDFNNSKKREEAFRKEAKQLHDLGKDYSFKLKMAESEEQIQNDIVENILNIKTALVGITQDADKDQHYWDRQGEYWKDLYYYWKAIFETSSDPKARKEAKPKMEEAKRKRDFAYQQFNSFITKDAEKLPDGVKKDAEGYYYYNGKGPYTTIEKALAGGQSNVISNKDAKLPTDWDVGYFNNQWYVTRNGQKYKGPFRSMKAAEDWLRQVRPDFDEDAEPFQPSGGFKTWDPEVIKAKWLEAKKQGADQKVLQELENTYQEAIKERMSKKSTDNDATEGGAIEQYGENKETESMPLEKEPMQAQDADIEQIPNNYRPEFPKAGFLVHYSNGMKAKWFATRQEAEQFIKQMAKEGKDSEAKRVQDAAEIIKMLGIM